MLLSKEMEKKTRVDVDAILAQKTWHVRKQSKQSKQSGSPGCPRLLNNRRLSEVSTNIGEA
jgi:hypothetical protein